MTDAVTASGLGAWAGDDLAVTARQHFGLGVDADMAPSVRLLSAVARLANTRKAVDQESVDPRYPAVFVLRPALPEELSAGTTFVPMVDNGLEQIAGRLWFVNEVVLAGRYMDIGAADDAAMFSLVTDMPGSGDVPTVMHDPRTTPETLRFYPAGLGNPDNCVVVPLESVDEMVDLDRILAVIDSVHESVLVTPDAQDAPGRLWADSDRGWPASQAEALIQMHLRTGLSVQFPTCRIRREQPGTPGRLDLSVERGDPRTPGLVRVFAVLELKVLRAFHSTGTPVPESETLDWVESGVHQAAAYRDDRHAAAAALCCFDMRREPTGESCFEHVRELAGRLQVTLRAWYVFASAAAYREYLSQES